MIQAIKSWLVRNTYCKKSDDIALSARLCGNWSFLCFVNRKLTYFIKLETNRLSNHEHFDDQHGSFGNLAYEYEVLQNLHQTFPEFIAKPITLGTIQNQLLYLQEAKEHQTLVPKLWKTKEAIRNGLRNFFQERGKLITSQKFSMPSAWIKDATELGLNSQLSIAKNLHVFPQHGDFCLSNVGIHKNSIFIFDWEDYARCDYPLLDISSFLVNLYDFNFSLLQRVLLNRTQDNLWLRSCLQQYAISVEKFLYLLPFSLFLFLKLKENLGYSNEVIAKTKKFIMESLMAAT